MTRNLSISALLALLAVETQGQVLLTWSPSPNAQGYIVAHWCQQWSQPAEIWFIGASTSYTTPPLPFGPNSFAVVGVRTEGSNMNFSVYSNATTVTNVPTVQVSELLLTSTNLTGEWVPLSTNQISLIPSDLNRFFRFGGLAITRTNQIIYPPNQ